MQLAIKSILYVAGALLLAGIIALAFYNPPKGKISRANAEIWMIQGAINYHRDALLSEEHLDNEDLVRITKLNQGADFRFNEKGEVLDPWGAPYVVTRSNDKITVKSRGVDRYNALSDFQKLWNYE